MPWRVASERQCGHWNQWQARNGNSETVGPEFFVAAGSCARKAIKFIRKATWKISGRRRLVESADSRSRGS